MSSTRRIMILADSNHDKANEQRENDVLRYDHAQAGNIAGYFAFHLDGGFETAWGWISPPYVVMNVFFLYVYYNKDWEQVQKQIRKEEEQQEGVALCVMDTDHAKQ